MAQKNKAEMLMNFSLLQKGELVVIRRAIDRDASRIAEISVFSKRMNYREIFHDDMVSFGEIQVGLVAGSYNIEGYRVGMMDAKLGLSFVLKLNGVLLNENFQVFKTWIEPIEEMREPFIPESEGEYTFDIYYQNKLVKSVTITVFNV